MSNFDPRKETEFDFLQLLKLLDEDSVREDRDAALKILHTAIVEARQEIALRFYKDYTKRFPWDQKVTQKEPARIR